MSSGRVKDATRLPPVDVAGGPRRVDLAAECAVLGGVAALSFLVVLLLGLFAVDGGRSPVPRHTSIVRVQAGDTLWEIADRYAPDSDPRAVVRRIIELNDLERASLAAGDVLRIPRGR